MEAWKPGGLAPIFFYHSQGGFTLIFFMKGHAPTRDEFRLTERDRDTRALARIFFSRSARRD
jgi:hypothetical protein